MNWHDLDLQPGARKLRDFGLVLMFVAAGATVWQGIVRHRPVVMLLLGLFAFLSGIAALLRPALLLPLYRVLTVATFPLGWLSSRLILAVAFYVVFCPFGLVMRLIRRDRMGRRFDPEAATYWEPKTVSNDPADYLRQF
jgi:hypothetical protein